MATLSEIQEIFEKKINSYELRMDALQRGYVERSLEDVTSFREQASLILLDIMMDLSAVTKARIGNRIALNDKVLDGFYYYLRDLRQAIQTFIELYK